MFAPPSQLSGFNPPPGYTTTAFTVRKLAELVREASQDPWIRTRAKSLVAGLTSMDYDGEIRAVWNFLVHSGALRYLRDPITAEHITTPEEMDRQIREEGITLEDCESIATYAASLLASIGIMSEFEIQGRDARAPQRFQHCALRVKNPRTSAWTSFDPVGAFAYPGAFDLGDSLALAGCPVERWSLDGKRSSALGELMTTLGEQLGDALGFGLSDLESGVKQYGPGAADALGIFGPIGSAIGAGAKLGIGFIPGPAAPASATATGRAIAPVNARALQLEHKSSSSSFSPWLALGALALLFLVIA